MTTYHLNVTVYDVEAVHVPQRTRDFCELESEGSTQDLWSKWLRIYLRVSAC